MDMRMEALSRGLLGMFFLIGLCYILSNNRKAINWKLVSMGIIAQIGFAIGVLTQGKYNFFRMLIQWLSDKFVQVIGFGHKGIEFMFGNLADASGSWGYTFAIQALPNIIFFAKKWQRLFMIHAQQRNTRLTFMRKLHSLRRCLQIPPLTDGNHQSHI
jgi:CNT family concentrative nucleoside transporter